MIRLNGEQMRKKLAQILADDGERSKNKETGNKNTNGNKWNGVGSYPSFKG